MCGEWCWFVVDFVVYWFLCVDLLLVGYCFEDVEYLCDCEVV